jgi:hypothetical protein
MSIQTKSGGFMKKLLLAFALVALSGLSGCDQPGKAPAPAVAHQPVSREEFTRSVMGKPDSVIMAEYGKPYLDNDYAEQLGILWVYRNLTFDPATGKQDQFATIVFEHGVVTKVVFK